MNLGFSCCGWLTLHCITLKRSAFSHQRAGCFTSSLNVIWFTHRFALQSPDTPSLLQRTFTDSNRQLRAFMSLCCYELHVSTLHTCTVHSAAAWEEMTFHSLHFNNHVVGRWPSQTSQLFYASVVVPRIQIQSESEKKRNCTKWCEYLN